MPKIVINTADLAATSSFVRGIAGEYDYQGRLLQSRSFLSLPGRDRYFAQSISHTIGTIFRILANELGSEARGLEWRRGVVEQRAGGGFNVSLAASSVFGLGALTARNGTGGFYLDRSAAAGPRILVIGSRASTHRSPNIVLAPSVGSSAGSSLLMLGSGQKSSGGDVVHLDRSAGGESRVVTFGAGSSYATSGFGLNLGAVSSSGSVVLAAGSAQSTGSPGFVLNTGAAQSGAVLIAGGSGGTVSSGGMMLDLTRRDSPVLVETRRIMREVDVIMRLPIKSMIGGEPSPAANKALTDFILRPTKPLFVDDRYVFKEAGDYVVNETALYWDRRDGFA